MRGLAAFALALIFFFSLEALLSWQVAGEIESRAKQNSPSEQARNSTQEEHQKVDNSSPAAAVAQGAPGLKLNAKGAILMDPQTGRVLWEQNAHFKGYPASMTKLMTMVVAMDAISSGQVSLDDPVRISERAESFGGAEVFLAEGEVFPLEKLLIAVAVASANDASVAVAEHIAGSEEAFVELMNKKAKELGLKDTHFTNCHGLHDPNHYTTPYDMALIARYALKYPKILEWTSIKRYTFRQDPLTILDTTNKMLYWYPGTDGFKTGYTEAAGLNLVSTVEREGLRLIAVVMGVETPRGHFTETMKLYNWAFRQWKWHKIYNPGEAVVEIGVDKGRVEKIEAVASSKVGAVVPKVGKQEVRITTRLEIPRFIKAPVKEGQKLGEIIILEDGREINRVDLLAGQAVSRATLKQEIQRVIRAVFTFYL